MRSVFLLILAFVSFAVSAEKRAETPHDFQQTAPIRRVEVMKNSLREILAVKGLKQEPVSIVAPPPFSYEGGKTPPEGHHFEDVFIRLRSEEDIPQLAEQFSGIQKDKDKTIRLLQSAWAKGNRYFPLKNLFPSFAKDRIGKFHPNDVDLMNCRSTVICFYDLKAEAKYLDEGDFANLLKKDFRELESGDTLRPGDMISVWRSKEDYEAGKGYKHRHSAIYLGGDLFFHKASSTWLDPFTIQNFNDVTNLYFGYAKRDQSPFVIFHRLKK